MMAKVARLIKIVSPGLGSRRISASCVNCGSLAVAEAGDELLSRS